VDLDFYVIRLLYHLLQVHSTRVYLLSFNHGIADGLLYIRHYSYIIKGISDLV